MPINYEETEDEEEKSLFKNVLSPVCDEQMMVNEWESKFNGAFFSRRQTMQWSR